jgi:16S rRNA (guanine527-N7)-methyltransferase
MKELISTTFSMLDFSLSPAQVSALQKYETELISWNQRFNLTAIRDIEQIRIKHFLDSLTCLRVIREPVGKLIDVGTGAGFPGLPLKIVIPSIQLTLVESVGKKADFCQHIVQQLGLEGVEVIQGRAEALGQMERHRQQYNWALARAVAIMPVLSEYLLPLVKVGGSMLAMKGESAHAETHSAEYAVQLLGGHLRKIIPITLPGVVENRHLVVIDKIAATPNTYPRRVGFPSKHPLHSRNSASRLN